MKKLFIYGAGGLGRGVIELAEIINSKDNIWDIKGFIDDSKVIKGKKINGYNVYSFEDIKNRFNSDDVEISVAIGDPYIKKNIIKNIEKLNCKVASLIHPNCYISKWNQIGKGVIIRDGCSISTNVIMHDYVIINMNCSIGHDVVINDYVTISPGSNISGNVNIGEMTYIGSGVNIRDELTIGDGAIVGIGSTVVKNIPSDVVVVGNPARVLKENIEKKVFK